MTYPEGPENAKWMRKLFDNSVENLFKKIADLPEAERRNALSSPRQYLEGVGVRTPAGVSITANETTAPRPAG